MSHLFIGCSGFNYPHWRHDVFYPEGIPASQEFAYYTEFFDTVEINNTFYREPRLSTWESWATKAPPGFLYALKMIHFLTHENRLRDPKTFWEHFYAGAQLLQSHLGPVLFQLPPHFTKSVERLENLAELLPTTVRIAFEFRDLSWFDDDIYQILEKHNWALVISSHPKLPLITKVTADFTYFRFHGIPKIYRSNYNQQDLEKFAAIISLYLKNNVDVFAYFNNDFNGYAPYNALALKNLISATRSG